MAGEPTYVQVRARDVKPYHYALWSSIEGGKPFANAICHIRWSEDGRHLWFGLDSHNTYKAEPDEVLDLIDLAGAECWERSRERKKDWVLPPPPTQQGPQTRSEPTTLLRELEAARAKVAALVDLLDDCATFARAHGARSLVARIDAAIGEGGDS